MNFCPSVRSAEKVRILQHHPVLKQILLPIDFEYIFVAKVNM